MFLAEPREESLAAAQGLLQASAAVSMPASPEEMRNFLKDTGMLKLPISRALLPLLSSRQGQLVAADGPLPALFGTLVLQNPVEFGSELTTTVAMAQYISATVLDLREASSRRHRFQVRLLCACLLYQYF